MCGRAVFLIFLLLWPYLTGRTYTDGDAGILQKCFDAGLLNKISTQTRRQGVCNRWAYCAETYAV